MKHGTFAGYVTAGMSEQPQQALAIRYLTQTPTDGQAGPVTLVVDFGINIAASGGQYSPMRETLSGHGFQWDGRRFKHTYAGIAS